FLASQRPCANSARLPWRVTVLASGGKYPNRANIPTPLSGWPLFSFSGNRGWIIPYIEVLRNVLDRTPGSSLVINWELFIRRIAQKNANRAWNLCQGQRAER